jgi:alkanesulfonate monooxygenase SsuD/methylene tetrahydromethanopterin reductase-like flavin-dependent oxidoreductase (luciferase family)
LGVPLTGSPEEIAERIRTFAEMGFTMLELVPLPDTDESAEALGEVLQILDV